MATQTIADMTAAVAADIDSGTFIEIETSGNSGRGCTLSVLFEALGIVSAAVASLGSASPTGKVKYATDGRKSGEGSGNGTGVLVQSNGTNWLTVDAGTTVAA